jgi:competence protein ComEC
VQYWLLLAPRMCVWIPAAAPLKHVTVQGVVTTVDARETSIRYTLRAEQLAEGEHTRTVNGNLLLLDHALSPRFQVGDSIEAMGDLELPEAFDGFAYDAYLSTYDIYTLMRPVSLRLLHEPTGFSLLRSLATMRTWMSTHLGTLYPEPQASLLDGLLTGNRSSIPQQVSQDFQRSGLTHLLAISGYNITIVILLISSVLFFLPLRFRLIPSAIAIILFTLFTGASASVVRAAIMGILGLTALHTGRINDTRLAVLWAAFFMLMLNPKEAWFDPSFQLSFLSVIGLMELQPLTVQWFKHLPGTWGLREALALTCSAQLFAAPWSALLFGQVSLIAPVANVLAAPLVPLSMLGGSLSLLCGWLWLPLGNLVAFLTSILLRLLLTIAHGTAQVPLAAIGLPYTEAWHVATYYLLLVLALAWYRRRPLTPSDTH